MNCIIILLVLLLKIKQQENVNKEEDRFTIVLEKGLLYMGDSKHFMSQ